MGYVDGALRFSVGVIAQGISHVFCYSAGIGWKYAKDQDPKRVCMGYVYEAQSCVIGSVLVL